MRPILVTKDERKRVDAVVHRVGNRSQEIANASARSKGVEVKRSRRGGRRPQHSGGGGGGGGNNRRDYTNPNRSFDSNGPEVKIRGTATQVYEKYLQLARDANSSGDRVMAENYLQHAEHYFRIMQEQQAAQQQYHQQNQFNQQNQQNRAPGQGEQPYPQRNGNGPSFSMNDGGEENAEEEPQEAAAG